MGIFSFSFLHSFWLFLGTTGLRVDSGVYVPFFHAVFKAWLWPFQAVTEFLRCSRSRFSSRRRVPEFPRLPGEFSRGKHDEPAFIVALKVAIYF